MNIFWNRSERRLRVIWRLLFQVVLMFVFSGLISFIMVIVMFLVPGGAAAILDRNDMNETLMDYFMLNPYASVLIMLASFLAIFFSIWLAGRFFDRRSLANYGFHFSRRWWLDFAFGLGLGAVLIIAIFIVQWAAGWVVIRPQNAELSLALPLVMLSGLFKFILVGIQEELVSRGYHLVNLSEGFSLKPIGRRNAVWLAYVLSSLGFGLLHLGNPNISVLSTINLCIAGLFLGLPFILSGELAVSIGLHITWNYFQGYVFGFPVSGLPSSGSLIAIQQGGPALWTGGAFGPEGGLLSLIVMLFGAALVVLWMRKTRGEVRLAERLGVYMREAETSIPVSS